MLNNYLTYEQFLEKTWREFWVKLVRIAYQEQCSFKDIMYLEMIMFLSFAAIHEGDWEYVIKLEER